MSSAPRPAFYALAQGGWRDYVTLLHLPYTLWHLSYVAIGAALAPELEANPRHVSPQMDVYSAEHASLGADGVPLDRRHASGPFQPVELSERAALVGMGL